MLQLQQSSKPPVLKFKDLDVLFKKRIPEIQSLSDLVAQHAQKARQSSTPSQIHQSFILGVDATRKLQQILEHLFSKDVANIETKFTKNLAQAELDLKSWKEKLTSEKSSFDSRWACRGISLFATFGILNLVEACQEAGKYIEDSDSYKTPGQRMQDDIRYYEGRVTDADNDVSTLTAYQKDFTSLSRFKLSQLYYPAIFSLIADHGILLYTQLLYSCADYATSPDEIASRLKKADPVCAKSFISLLRADYKNDDLITLVDYGCKTKISGAGWQSALLQFINHNLVIHSDFVKLWVSKVTDLENNQEEISGLIAENKITALPKLEILSQKPVRLSGAIEEQSSPKADTPATARALEFVFAANNEARKKVTELIEELKDTKQGNLKQRQQSVKKSALKQIQQFSILFNGLETALKQIDISLGEKKVERAKIWQLFMSAEAIANQIAIMNFNSPKNMRAFRKKMLMASIGARLTIGDQPPLGEWIAAMAQGELINDRYEIEYNIRMESLLKRQHGNPNELKKTVDTLDAEIEKLLDNKEFMFFLSNGNLENVRIIYMILTRLVAGEANLDALEQFAITAGFKSIDQLMTRIKAAKPRLAQAMENFIYGFANSNDLAVMIAEGNVKKQKASPVEHLVEDFTDEIIKPHYSDFARQASIVDYLSMRNALYTGHSFHSFGEVVKRSEPALVALLSGNGDFVLTGNSDVHQLFGYYLSRHGERTFIDPHNRNNRKPKTITLSHPDDLRNKNREIAAVRSEETIIPQLGNVFIELCAYEYLLPNGNNVVKNKKLIAHPHFLGATEMVNEMVRFIIEKLQMKEATARVGNLVEGLIADSIIQFFSELGALHLANPQVQEKIAMVKNSYTGENFSLPHSLYTKMITNDAKTHFDLFLQTYQHVLQNFLTTCTRENRTALIQQLKEVEPVMKTIQPAADIVWPDSELALLNAYHRDHSLENVSVNRETWFTRSMAV